MKVCKKLLSLFLMMLALFCVFPISIAMNVREMVSAEEVSTAEKSRPKVSVIVPVYNTEPYLRECLDSIKNQTLKEIEIICVDDGSTDNCGKILDEYAAKDSRFIVIHQENKGGAAARNAGMVVATGEYIAFVDSDDTIDKKAYSVSYDKIREVAADILIFSGDNASHRSLNKLYNTGFELLYENRSLAIVPWNKLYKRKFLMDNHFLFPDKQRVCHDESFNAVVFPKAKRVICIEDILYNYTRHRPGSLQTASSVKMNAENLLIFADFVCRNWCENGYIKEHGEWLLLKTLGLFNFHVFKHREKLDTQEKKHYSKTLLEILSPAIYNSDQVTKYSKYTQKLIRELEHAARHPEDFQSDVAETNNTATKKMCLKNARVNRLRRKVIA